MPRKPTSGARRKRTSGGLIRKLRKPIPPPTRIVEDERKYSRPRQRERLRREEEKTGETDSTDN
jgi:hypothetical protein